MTTLRHLLHRIAATLRRRRADAELEREIQAHLRLLEDRFLAEGMSAAEARFAARRAFGNLAHTKELQRDTRSFGWLTGWALEFRLGIRMLLRYPGLTVIGGLAMALAIVVGASVFEVVQRAMSASLPLPDGEGIIGLTYWDQKDNVRKSANAYDFSRWRNELTSLEDVGAFRLVQRNLAPEGGVAEPVTVAQISPSAFRVTKIPPMLGRALVESDEDPAAPGVVVLGHALWKSRFGADPAVVGRPVRLGTHRAIIAGVMPEGYAFPVDDQIWMPLRPAELSREPGAVELRVFGRLARGGTLLAAQSEAALIATRSAAEFPDHYGTLRPQVLPYAKSILWFSPDVFVNAGIQSINAFAVLMMIVICGNVALLMLTRTATREREVVVRTALGATRRRILTQFLLEALLLAALAAAVGLAATDALLRAVSEQLRSGPDRWPFWFQDGLSVATVGYAGALALLGAVIVGVVPALKILGPDMADRLRQSTAGGGGLRMGKVWTGLVVAQIAATVLFAATAYIVHRQAEYLASVETVFPRAKYVVARLEMESDSATAERKAYAAAVAEFERRLAAEDAVAGVTIAEQLPLMPGPSRRGIEVSGSALPEPVRRLRIAESTVAPSVFRVFQMPVLAGRTFDSRDLGASANTVVVNALFVERVLGGRNAIGQRIRYHAAASNGDGRAAPEPGPWLEIIGVVRDLAPDAGAPLNLDNPAQPRLYHCLKSREGEVALHVAVHARHDPRTVGPVLRRIAGEVSPLLRIHDILPLDHHTGDDARIWRNFANALLAGSAVILFLSRAGIYSVTSYTVSRRTREIGVRVALGAPAFRVIATVFRGPLLQVGAGVAAGCALLGIGAMARSGQEAAIAMQLFLIAGYGIAVMSVCLLACIAPALRALRVDPIEALREDA